MARPLPLFHPKVLGASVAAGAAAGAAGGALVAVVARAHPGAGAAAGVLVVGLVALFAGLLGATEPPEGWHSGGLRRALRGDAVLHGASPEHVRRARELELARRRGGRRSLAARAAASHPALAPVTSASLLVWALVVGGGLTAAGVALVELASVA
ncbi:MAG TPA: hypothetical protein VHJ34_11710 [Actinomycetota bacterium]|nr:hypothetical protein [Actinomycetota bacterium]